MTINSFLVFFFSVYNIITNAKGVCNSCSCDLSMSVFMHCTVCPSTCFVLDLAQPNFFCVFLLRIKHVCSYSDRYDEICCLLGVYSIPSEINSIILGNIA